NPEPVTMKDLAKIIYDGAMERGLIERSENGLRFESKMSFSDDVMIRIPDVTKAKDILGWKPTLKTAESVGQCLDLMETDERKAAVTV
ncbi:MAG: hypothetical protein H7070_00150, partial [Saprospiraceae bacterium]|nr:hypothetical protein [Pyrinomonadaceae bacterium]